MKKLAIVFVIFATVFSSHAEEVKLSSVAVSAGKGALTSGFVFEAGFSQGNNFIGTSFGKEDVYAYYLKSLWEKASIGPCLEYYCNTPVLGLLGTTSPCKNVSTFTWAGWSAGNPGKKITPTRWRFLFFYQSVTLSYKRVSGDVAIMYYDGWQPLLVAKYTHPVTEKISISTNIGYNFFEYKKKEWGESAMLGMKITYTP